MQLNTKHLTAEQCVAEKRQMALCIAHTDLNRPIQFWKPSLIDRAAVDDKKFLTPAIKQLLPYVTMTRMLDGRKQVLTYLRGDGSAESRLRSKRSIGIGGHVDTMTEDWANNAIIHLTQETLRECLEEIPSLFSHVASVSALYHTIKNQFLGYGQPGAMDLNVIDVRYAPVDQVHIGIRINLDLSAEGFSEVNTDALIGERNQVVDLRWEFLSDLVKPEVAAAYEGWSKYVLWRMSGAYSLVDDINAVNVGPLADFPRYGIQP